MTTTDAQTSEATWVVPNEIWRVGERFFRVNKDKPGTGDELVLRNNHPPVSLGLFFGIVAGIMFTSGVWVVALTWDYSPPVELTADDRVGTRVQVTFPMTFSVSLVPPEEIRRRIPNAYAYSTTGPGRECHIYFPTGRAIVFSSQDKRAVWDSRSDGDTFAHEILHCLRGSWHPE